MDLGRKLTKYVLVKGKGNGVKSTNGPIDADDEIQIVEGTGS